MKKRFALKVLAITLTALWIYNKSDAQFVTVSDHVSLQPVENVVLANADRSISIRTDIRGKANLDKFSETDDLFINHPDYKSLITSFTSLREKDFKVVLTPCSFSDDEPFQSPGRWEQSSREVPNQVVRIKGGEADFRNPQTCFDLLASGQDVLVSRNQAAGGNVLMMGFGANSVLYTLDGIRINNPGFRAGTLDNLLYFDALALGNTEILMGAASTFYGSDALGGLISLHTKDVHLSPTYQTLVKINALSRYSTAAKEKTGHVDLNFGRHKFGSLTSVTYSSFDDLLMGTSGPKEYRRLKYSERNGDQDEYRNNDDPDLQKYSGYDQLSLMQKLLFKPSDNFEMGYTFIYNTLTDVPRYDQQLLMADDTTPVFADSRYEDPRWVTNILHYRVKGSNAFFDQHSLRASWQNIDELRSGRKFNSVIEHRQEQVVDQYALNVDFLKTLDNINTITYGLEGILCGISSKGVYRNTVTGEEHLAPSLFPAGDNNCTTLSGYFGFTSNFDKNATFQSGIRYSRVILESTMTDTVLYHFPFANKYDINTSSLSGHLGLTYRPGRGWQLNALASSAFRAPNLDEVRKVYDSKTYLIVPNENLTPENAFCFEAGFTKNFSGKAILRVTGFYTYLTNALIQKSYLFNGMDTVLYNGLVCRVQAVVNAGKASLYGGRAYFTIDIGRHVSLKSSFTWQTGEDNLELPWQYITPFYGGTTMSFQVKKLRLEVYATYCGELGHADMPIWLRYKEEAFALDGSGHPYSPAWFTLNFRGAYYLNKYLQVNLGVENIFDERYKVYGSALASPGRSVIAALRFTL
jgi:hemoglobin/transferrin/lactoferrin receptor protein